MSTVRKYKSLFRELVNLQAQIDLIRSRVWEERLEEIVYLPDDYFDDGMVHVPDEYFEVPIYHLPDDYFDEEQTDDEQYERQPESAPTMVVHLRDPNPTEFSKPPVFAWSQAQQEELRPAFPNILWKQC